MNRRYRIAASLATLAAATTLSLTATGTASAEDTPPSDAIGLTPISASLHSDFGDAVEAHQEAHQDAQEAIEEAQDDHEDAFDGDEIPVIA
ncbi:hypothetical protein SAMN05216188_1193 [Lentzea xinjiangensis]|uniref:Uncharacterized protein n=1 Tax=Lentzea xinjiangensis TaxID=402600 RepID=A0A1H9TQG2_9PSEU|nr:hypothetical protein [Lentzea xinjiangensis]SER99229.1 hypothetical protein SAMN05216188_1193 [Lentzea xinjiangensis]